jgi:hypothetical protein
MEPATERLIALATRPLDFNPELHLAAGAELRRQIKASRASQDDVAEAADLLANANRRPRRRQWKRALYLTTLLVSLPVLVHTGWQAHAFSGLRCLYTLCAAPTPDSSSLIAGITPQQKLLLLGDEKAGNTAERWKPLWDSDPENPAYFAEYAAAFYRDHQELTPEILATAERIDPGNGWYLATSAAGIRKDSVEKTSLTAKERKEGKAPAWEIKDAKSLQEALTLIHQAAGKPKFTTYQEELLRQRVPLFFPRADYATQLPPLVYVANQSSAVIHLHHLDKAMSAGAQECAKNRDVAGFHQIVGDWRWLCKASAEQGFFLIDMLVARIVFTSPLANFRDAARSLGLEEEARGFSDAYERVKADKGAREKQGRAKETVTDPATRRGSMLGDLWFPMITRQVNSPPPLTEAELRPGRYADHALFGRAASLLSWILLGLCAGFAALSRFRQNLLVRVLSKRMLDLLRPADWAWIMICGILLPVIWFYVITRLTPLGAREWSLRRLDFIPASGQFGSLAALLVIFPGVLASSRLCKRGAPLGLCARFRWIGKSAAVAAALAIPAFGAIELNIAGGRIPLIIACALLGFSVLWMLVEFGRNTLGLHLYALRRATLARMVHPAWIFGMLIMAVSAPLHYAEERFWIRQDKLFEITAEHPAPTRYEWEVTQVLRKELLEMME